VLAEKPLHNPHAVAAAKPRRLGELNQSIALAAAQLGDNGIRYACRGFVIYVKRVSVLGADLHLWHGFDEGAALPESPLFRSIHCYHVRFRPHEKADIILIHPEELHSFSDRAPRA
jgi:hypothetical protein